MRTYISVTVARTPYSHGYSHASFGRVRVENGGGGGPTGRDHAQSAAGPGGSGGGDTPPPFGGEIGCRRGRMTSPRQNDARRSRRLTAGLTARQLAPRPRAAAAMPYAPAPPAPRFAGASGKPRVTCTWRRPATVAGAPSGYTSLSPRPRYFLRIVTASSRAAPHRARRAE